MKRLLLLSPLLVVLGGCATTKNPPHPPAATLSRAAQLDDVPLRLDVARLQLLRSRGVLLLDSRTGHELDPLENDVDLSGAFQFGD
jgi:hypothetical protein